MSLERIMVQTGVICRRCSSNHHKAHECEATSEECKAFNKLLSVVTVRTRGKEAISLDPAGLAAIGREV